VAPSDPNVVWVDSGEANIRENGSGHGAVDLRYRFQWTAPIVISPHGPKVVYHAANVLFKTNDYGSSWKNLTAGLDRVSWDLKYGEPKWMPDARFETGTPQPDPLVVPGDYTLRLTVEGRSTMQPLTVELDSRTSVSESDLKEELAYGLGVRAQLARIVAMVETIRGVRDQVKDRNARITGNPGASELVDLGEKLIADLIAVEEEIHNPRAEVDYDVLAGRHVGAKLFSQVAWLLELSADHDGPPTQGMLEVAADLERQLTAQEAAPAGLLSEDLAKLNELAREKDVPYVVTHLGK